MHTYIYIHSYYISTYIHAGLHTAVSPSVNLIATTCLAVAVATQHVVLAPPAAARVRIVIECSSLEACMSSLITKMAVVSTYMAYSLYVWLCDSCVRISVWLQWTTETRCLHKQVIHKQSWSAESALTHKLSTEQLLSYRVRQSIPP